MKIGVFDSGRDDEFIADGLKKLLPEYDYVVVNDREHVPYGSRSNAKVLQRPWQQSASYAPATQTHGLSV